VRNCVATSCCSTNRMSNKAWVPRVLKKRATEFKVGPDAAPPGAGARSLTGMLPEPKGFVPRQVSWGGAADLDDLEEDDAPVAKKPKPSDQAGSSSDPPAAAAASVAAAPAAAAPAAAAPAAAAQAAPAAPAAPRDEGRDEIIDAAPRLAQHIASSAKFTKVAAMAYSLLDGGRVTSENAAAFFTVLAAGVDRGRVREKQLRVAYKKLYGAAMLKSHLFSPAAQRGLKLWAVHVLAQIELFTDDTFQFNRAAKQVREALQGLPCIFPALEPKEGATHLPEAERPEWITVLFDCVETAMAHHKHAWARTTCDMLVSSIVDRRQNFSEEQQEEIQAWNARCKGQKIVRQQEYSAARKEQTAYEKKEAEWGAADIAKNAGGRGTGGLGVDN